MSRRFTPEQRAAIEARTGSSLLAANAGSGKTAVMVERIAEAVRLDGTKVSAILALTFTEKAAGELAERLRRRLTELGETEAARAVDAAWIGTIHGFCARLLRSQPLAAGLDPRFEVLEETAAERLQTASYEQALEEWARVHGQGAIDLAASYGINLKDLVLSTYATLRARGESKPRLTVPPAVAAPDPTALSAAAAAALHDLRLAGAGVRVSAGRDALTRCQELIADAVNVPWPGVLGEAELKGGAKALQSDPCEDYRTAWDAYRRQAADFHARTALELLDSLLKRFGRTYEAAKAERAAVDFEDLELRARDLLADPATRAKWAEKFTLIMIDEFQDTNAVQLGILEGLERENLFAVGDEFQSIYRFRHADVSIFRRRAEGVVRHLSMNFRSREELLDVLNAAFRPELGERFAPLRAGRKELPVDDQGRLQLFSLDPPGEPPVELHVTTTQGWDEHAAKLGLAQGGDQPWRRAEARLVADRLRREVEANRRPGDIVVLVRATASLRLFEEALEEQGLPTYVVGGRGYWSQEQVRDGLAWLRVLANPHDEDALLNVLASPFHGASTDELILLAEEGRRRGSLWEAVQAQGGAIAQLLKTERELAERSPLEVLLERAIVATGYDLAVLARPGGDRRLANLRKLMRLAGEYERSEGRDLRGFLAEAAARDLAEAREGEAALESDGLDAIRLMTIHRAKGLEFPVVCVADLGRGSGARRPSLLVGDEGKTGIRLAPLGGGDTIPTTAWEELAAAEAEADAEEERRLFYVAMTRAKELLILSGGTDTTKWPAPRNAGPPIDWITRAVVGEPTAVFGAAESSAGESGARREPAASGAAGARAGVASGASGARGAPASGTAATAPGRAARGAAASAAALGAAAAAATPAAWAGGPCARDGVLERRWDGRPARVAVALNTPETLPESALNTKPKARVASTTALPAVPAKVEPASIKAQPTPQRLSYSQISDYGKCGYRFYLRRVLGMPSIQPPPPEEPETVPSLDPRVRGSIVHSLLEELDFANPQAPALDGDDLTQEQKEDIQRLVTAFASSPLCERLAKAKQLTREAEFSFTLEPDGSGPLVRGFVDVFAVQDDGTHLVVDYKTDSIQEDPEGYVARNYETQRLVYALAALRNGAEKVEVAYCLLDYAPEQPITRTYTADQAPELADEINRLATGILTHRYPVTRTPHRELCGECPGRTSLCSYSQAETLKPPQAPWPGAPARHMSPAGT